MYEDMGYTDAAALEAMIAACRPYLAVALRNGSFRAWLASSRARIVGGGAILVSPWPSHAYDVACRRATILNLYVHPDYRLQGIARRLMQTMIAWCRRQRFARVWLHASTDGRHLYESLGFEPGNEMQLKLR
jgi:GNAT superfamily N-acetyltransferase